VSVVFHLPGERTFFYPFNADFDALYGPLILHVLLIVVHRRIVNTFPDNINLNPILSGQWLQFKPQRH